MRSSRLSVSLKDDLLTFSADNSVEAVPLNQIQRLIRIEYGGDLIGLARGALWVFDLGNGAIVVDNAPAALRRDILRQLGPEVRAGISWLEGSCFKPPRKWSAARWFRPADQAKLVRIGKQDLLGTLETIRDLHAVQEFGDEGL
jgi:hypothetical protein